MSSNKEQLQKLVNEASLEANAGYNIPPNFKRVTGAEIFVNRTSGEVVILGEPHERKKSNGDPIHNCDERGCTSLTRHVLFRGSTEE